MKKVTLILFVMAMAGMNSMAQEFKEKSPTVFLDFNRPIETNTLPEIHWNVPAAEVTGSPTSEVTIDVAVESHHALGEVMITVLGTGGREFKQKIEVGEFEFSKTVSMRIPLFDGDNRLLLSAANSKGGRITSERNVRMSKDAMTKMLFANRRDLALIFASDRYESYPSQQSPIADALALEEVLKFTYGFETEVVRNPNWKEIQKKLAEYQSKTYSGQDQLLIYFSGNCLFDELMGFGYIVAANSARNDLKRTTLFQQKDIRNMLDGFSCKHLLLITDVCCADLADPKAGNSVVTAASTTAGLVSKLGLTTRKFLSAGSTEYQPGISGQRSPFTGRLIGALQQNTMKIPVTFSYINNYFKNFDAYAGGFGSDELLGDFIFLPR